jgi:hypothetical protein
MSTGARVCVQTAYTTCYCSGLFAPEFVLYRLQIGIARCNGSKPEDARKTERRRNSDAVCQLDRLDPAARPEQIRAFLRYVGPKPTPKRGVSDQNRAAGRQPGPKPASLRRSGPNGERRACLGQEPRASQDRTLSGYFDVQFGSNGTVWRDF